MLLSVVGILTLLAVFVESENWRGDRAWAALEKELDAKGETLELSASQPPAVPDEKNLFKAPNLALLFYDRPADQQRKRLLEVTRFMEYTDLANFRGKLRDFPTLRDHLRKIGLLTADSTGAPAADVLKALQPLQPLLDELREAARLRPQARLAWNPNPFGSPTVDIDSIYQLGIALSVRAAAEVDLGRAEEAAADIYALQRLANGLSIHPATLLRFLIGEALDNFAAGAIADGYQSHIWNERRLAEFQKLLEEDRPLAEFREAEEKERNMMIYLADAKPRIPIGITKWPWWLFHGWVQQNKVTFWRHLDNVLASFTTDPERVFSERLGPLDAELGAYGRYHSPYDWLSSIAAYNSGGILRGVGTQAERLRLYFVSFAVERYRLAHGRYPEKLDDLVPEFLSARPIGIIDGQLIRYIKVPQGGCELHSCGWLGGHNDGRASDDIVVKLPDMASHFIAH